MRCFRRGDVVRFSIPIKIGSCVQGGNRLWVIVQNDIGNYHSPTTIVCPLTTKLKCLHLPTHVIVRDSILKMSMVECEQVRVIDIRSNWKYVSTLSKSDMDKIDAALRNTFFM